MTAGPDTTLWIELLASLALGATVAVGLAAVASRATRAAHARRTIWQACILGLPALTAFELSGVAPVVVQGLRSRDPADRGMEAPLVWGAQEDASAPGVVVGHRSPSPAPGDVTVRRELRAPSPAELREIGAEALLVPGRGGLPAGRKASRVGAAAAAEKRAKPAAGRAPAGFWWPGALWLVGAFLICGRSLFARLLLARTRRRLDDVDDGALRRRMRLLADGLGVLTPIALKQSEGLGAPITFGLFRPTIVLPRHFDSEFTETKQDVVLAHELAHIANGDALWQLISECSCALLWWLPFSWYARQRLQVESEFAADEATTLIHRGPETLAECLVELAARLSRRPRLGLLPIRGRGFRSSLGRRVERLVRLESSARPPRPGHDHHRFHAGRFAALAGSLAVVATITLSTAWARTSRSQTGDPDMDTRTPGVWRRSVAGFVFASLFTLSDGDASTQDTSASVGTSTDDVAEKAKTNKPARVISDLVRGAQDAVLDDAPATKKKARNDPGRGTGTTDDRVEDETTKPGAKKKKTGSKTKADPRPFLDPLLPVNPPQPPDIGRNGPLPPRASLTPRNSGQSLSTGGAIYDRGTGLFLDLVNLATALTDARGEVELQRLDYTRFSELIGQNLVSETEFLKAKILLETAQRKADILQRMGEAALNSSMNLLKQLHTEYELESQRVRVGTASQAELASVSTRLAAAEGNVEILESLLTDHRRKTSTSTGGTASATRRRVPKSLGIGVDGSGQLTFEGEQTDLETLSKTLQGLVPQDARASCAIRLELESNCPLQKVTAVLARLENLKFAKVNLTTRGSKKRLRTPAETDF